MEAPSRPSPVSRTESTSVMSRFAQGRDGSCRVASRAVAVKVIGPLGPMRSPRSCSRHQGVRLARVPPGSRAYRTGTLGPPTTRLNVSPPRNLRTYRYVHHVARLVGATRFPVESDDVSVPRIEWATTGPGPSVKVTRGVTGAVASRAKQLVAPLLTTTRRDHVEPRCGNDHQDRRRREG
jgi:hypothetical protein